MRALKIFEAINFERGGDPLDKFRVGIKELPNILYWPWTFKNETILKIIKNKETGIYIKLIEAYDKNEPFSDSRFRFYAIGGFKDKEWYYENSYPGYVEDPDGFYVGRPKAYKTSEEALAEYEKALKSIN